MITNIFRNMPPVTKNLLIVNVIVWLFTALCGPSFDQTITKYCALHYFSASDFNPGQLITYMFMHAGFAHLFFNMFALVTFGGILENSLGSARYLFYYMTCGIGAALVQEGVWALTWESTWIPLLAQSNHMDVGTMTQLVNQAVAMGEDLPFLNHMLTVGASGAIFGLLLAFAMIFPNLPLYIWFIPIPIKAKWMALGYGLLELGMGLTGAGSSIAHFAHLGGMIFGLILILYWKHKGEIYRRY